MLLLSLYQHNQQECKIDAQCRPVAQATRQALSLLNGNNEGGRIVVCDPFAGSGNSLFNVSKELKANYSVGFEKTHSVAVRTQENLKNVGFGGDLKEGSFDEQINFQLPQTEVGAQVVVLIDPPWGEGFEFGKGLNLCKTSPTVPAIIDHAEAVFKAQASRVIFVILGPDTMVEESVQAVLKGRQLLARGAGTELPKGSNGGYIILTKIDQDEANEFRNSLLGPKRDVEISLEEIRKAGRVFFGSEDRYKLFGLDPDGLSTAGCKLVGRTVVEAQIDAQCTPVANGMKQFLNSADASSLGQIVVLDIFAGSANLLYHTSKEVNAVTAIGVELDPTVVKSTRENIAKVGFHCDFLEGSFLEKSEPALSLLPDGKKTVFVIIAPPWASAFEFGTGLVLDRTSPGVPEVLEYTVSAFAGITNTRLLLVILTSDLMDEDSVKRVLSGGPYKLLGRGVGKDVPVGSNAGYILCEKSDGSGV